MEALLFLVTTFFEMYVFLLVIRVLLAFAGASYSDPLTQFVAKCSDFIIKPMRRVLPNARGIEIATLCLIFILEIIKIFLVANISNINLGLPNLVILAFADMLRLFLQTLCYAIILQAILSWVQPGSPINSTLFKVTAPVMRPIQRFIPPIGGMDISPLFAIILLQFLIIALVNPLIRLGYGVNFG
jgi:YggT family protein